jgi:hypothetical protein
MAKSAEVKNKRQPIVPFTFDLSTQEKIEYLAALMVERIDGDLASNHEVLLRARDYDAAKLRTPA